MRSITPKSFFIALVIVFFAGAMVDRAMTPDVEQIRSEAAAQALEDRPADVVTRTVTEAVEVPVEVPGELPSECVRAIEKMHDMTAEMGTIDTAAGGILQAAPDLHKAAEMNDTNGMVTSIETLRGYVGTIDTSIVATTDLAASVDGLLAMCQVN